MHRNIMQVQAVICASLVLVALLGGVVKAEDSLCSINGFRCVGPSLYQQCAAPPDSFIFKCDSGFVCSTAEVTGQMCVEQPPSCEKQGAFRVNGTCNRYYLCINNGYTLIQYIGYCAAGYEFSTSAAQCVKPQYAGCSQPLPIASSTIATSNTESTPFQPKPTNTPFVCPSLGTFADPTSCRSFYYCLRHHSCDEVIAIKQKCPIFLPHFNPERSICWYFNDTCTDKC